MASIDAESRVGTAARVRTLGRGRPGVLGVTRAGVLVGVIALESELDPLADPLAHAVRRGGRQLLPAGLQSGLEEQLAADGLVAGGTRLAATVRSLQRAGHGVLLVSGGPAHVALRGADVGVGVGGHGRHPPWGAALLTRPGLAEAHLVVESLPVAGSVARLASPSPQRAPPWGPRCPFRAGFERVPERPYR